MNDVTTLGIDLAKNVFALHAVDASGRVVMRRSVRRSQLSEVVAQLPPCLIRMEACSGAHEWARRFSQFGHTVKLMAAKFVSAYRKNGKNDGNDAEAICEAVSRPNMRFVPVKSREQQAQLSVHRVRSGFVEQRTATLNRLRGLLSEFGHVLPLSARALRTQTRRCWSNCRRRRLPQRWICWSTCASWSSVSPTVTGRSSFIFVVILWHNALNVSPGWASECLGDRGQRGCCARVQERSAVCCLAGPCAPPALHRRQATARTDHA